MGETYEYKTERLIKEVFNILDFLDQLRGFAGSFGEPQSTMLGSTAASLGEYFGALCFSSPMT